MHLGRFAIGASAAVLVVGPLSGGAAWAGTRIKPNQHFVGFVNGKRANGIVYTACPGPYQPGQLGPPVGDKVSVKEVAQGGGDTGSNGRVSYAYVPGAPPAITALDYYGQVGTLPNTARVPCQGTGTLYFTTCPLPQPCGVGAQPFDVSVTFENIAV
jgi:hypothetical protein